MVEVGVVEGLAGSLLEVVADPGRVNSLYDILREYCHQFRNRLNSLKLSLYLARRLASDPRDEIWEDLQRKYREVERLIEQLQEICRPMQLNLIRFTLGALLEDRLATWTNWMSAQGRRLELVRPDSPVVGCFDPTRLTQALDGLASWRSNVGEPGTPVLVSWGAEHDRLVLNWEEPEADCLDAAIGQRNRPVSLALPVLARVISAHGGALDITVADGLRIGMWWPREDAPRSPALV